MKMNNVIRWASTILIIMLVTVLIWIFVSYYNAPIDVTPDENIYVTPGTVGGEIEKETIVSTNIEPNGSEPIKVPEQIIPTKNEDTVIMTSDTKISNIEKQRVLSEIDDTLMDLLEIVDKVPTVDESRLGVDEKEVQP